MKVKINLEKFICSLMKRYYEIHNIDPLTTKCWLDKVLEDQGLEYRSGEIVEISQESEDERIRKSIIAIINNYVDNSNTFKPKMLAWLEKQGESGTFNIPQTPIKDAVEVTSRMQFISDDMKPIAEFIMGYANWDLHKDEWNQPTLTVPLFRVLDALIQRGKPYGECSQNIEKQGEQKPADKVEPKFKVKYAGNEYNVFETKDIAGVTFYGIEDEPNHIDYVKAENCEIISVYAIKENGSPYPTKPAVFSEKKPKRMISAEAKECIYGSDNEQVSSEKISKNDTLLDLLQKMPSCITVDGIDYHFVLKKTIAYMAFYEGEGEEGRDKIIFWMAGEPIELLTAMLNKLKEEGLLE